MPSQLNLTALSALLICAPAALATAVQPRLVVSANANTGVARIRVGPLDGSGAIVLADGRDVVLSCRQKQDSCEAEVPLVARTRRLHGYLVDPADGRINRFSEEDRPATATLAKPLSPQSAGLPPVGILYEVWHGFTANAYANISRQGGTPLCVEDVLRSPNGTLTMYDVLDKWGVRNEADRFFYQEQPTGGYYCLYRHRPGETGLVPDCAGISATAARHASELTSIGVSFVAVDATNLGTPSTEAEVIQVRPAEVLFEEWAALRESGVPTPAIAAWQRAEAGGTLWRNWLELYNNASYDGLVARAPPNAPGGTAGKKLFFVPSNPDPSIVGNITSNGGRNDIVVVSMWANDHKGPHGEWAFMAPCTNATNATAGPGAVYTTSIVGLGRGASACFQQLAVGSPLGSSLSFSPSYQLLYGSTPFSSAGKYEGLTFKRQWATLWELAGQALDAAAAAAAAEDEPQAAAEILSSSLPDSYFVSSYNEWTSQPQPNPYPQPWAISMGLWGDNESSSLFVDTYGTALARDIEPSAREGGDVIFNLLASCLRVATVLSAAVADVAAELRGEAASIGGAFAGLGPAGVRASFGARAGIAGLTSCAVAGEECCSYNETVEGYVPVWSFKATNATDFMAAVDPTEPGARYKEVCTGFPGNSDFCRDPSVLGGVTAWQGPFILHSGGCGLVSAGVPAGVPVTPTLQLPGRLPLYRCVTNNNNASHFLSSSADCDGMGSQALPLGCTHATRSSNMPRPLRGCVNASSSDAHYHITDGVCADGDRDRGVLGYVR